MSSRLRLVGAPESRRSVADPISVVLADDHAAVRRSLRLLLDGEEGIEVVAEASNLDGASRALQAHRPQVLVLDLLLSDGAGRTTIGDLLAAAPRTRIVVVTMNDSPAFAHALLEVGVAGFVLKELADSDLPRAIREAAGGGEYVSPRLAERLRWPRTTRDDVARDGRDA
jgi:two-component system response regulator NreC